MSRIRKQQVIAGAIGILYAVIYGFWTMLATGGGHGNFTWIGLFVFVEFFGLYFPLMAILAVNLRAMITKVVFGGLIVFNLLASSIMIIGWITEPAGIERASDFQRQLEINGIGVVLFCTTWHFLPTLFFAALLVRSILFGIEFSDEDAVLSINLHD